MDLTICGPLAEQVTLGESSYRQLPAQISNQYVILIKYWRVIDSIKHECRYYGIVQTLNRLGYYQELLWLDETFVSLPFKNPNLHAAKLSLLHGYDVVENECVVLATSLGAKRVHYDNTNPIQFL